ncbi:hypothetical protein Glove_173g2 [Diversispora epigaea]|uniref:ribonuclease H n=1 Tax=Diversispora epigaea TaxID=1348612 RepID=A0A397IYN4_9GLOM|nr:hypothetical protein Glove_173g2 [Diversispora epigaea]
MSSVPNNTEKTYSVVETQKQLIITDESTKGRILDIQKALSSAKDITCYTDRSLSKNKGGKSCLNEVRMGIGLVLESTDFSGRLLDFDARIEGPASSTRPELWAILMALELAPSFSRLQIFTDSASAIAAIKLYLLDKWGKKVKTLKNQDILQVITDKCNGKQIQFTLFKVAAHSGIALNERADKLAKKGTNKGTPLRINTAFLQRNVNYMWDNNSLDINIKDFGKTERNVNCAKRRITSHEELTYEETRGIQIKKCIICKRAIEDTLHPFECGNYNRVLRNKVIEKLAIIGKNQGSKFEKSEIVKNFRNENFMKIDTGRQLRGTIESDRFSFVDITRGLSYRHMEKKIKAYIITGKDKIQIIQLQIFNYLRELMKTKWMERCQMVLAWEKEEGIEGKSKWKQKKRKEINKRKQIPNGEYADTKAKLENENFAKRWLVRRDNNNNNNNNNNRSEGMGDNNNNNNNNNNRSEGTNDDEEPMMMKNQ